MHNRSIGVLGLFVLLGLQTSAVSADAKLDRQCDAATTFVFVPSDQMLKSMGSSREKYLADYLAKNAGPADEDLKRCGLTRDGWRQLVREKILKP